MYLVGFVLPIKGDYDVEFSFPVVGDCVVFLEVRDEILDMIFSNIFHAKVVNN